MAIDITLNYSLRVLLVFIFLRAMFHKMRHYQHFVAQLESYRLLPAMIVPASALFLILIEGLLAISLLRTSWPAPPFVATGLLAVYSAAMLINLIRGRTDLDCGCNGPATSAQAISWALVIRNGVLGVLCLVVALPVTARVLSIPDLATIALAGSAVILIYASLEQAIANQQRSRDYALRNARDSLGFFE